MERVDVSVLDSVTQGPKTSLPDSRLITKLIPKAMCFHGRAHIDYYLWYCYALNAWANMAQSMWKLIAAIADYINLSYKKAEFPKGI